MAITSKGVNLRNCLCAELPISAHSALNLLNVFDNPLFSGPVATFGTSNFGQITTVNGFARSLQFQARVTF